MGHRKEPITITTNGEPYGIRLKKEDEVEEHMKKIWIENFSPTPREKIHPETRREVNQFFFDNPNIEKPFGRVDLSRLNPNCDISKPISPIEVIRTITTFGDKAPGEDQI